MMRFNVRAKSVVEAGAAFVKTGTAGPGDNDAHAHPDYQLRRPRQVSDQGVRRDSKSSDRQGHDFSWSLPLRHEYRRGARAHERVRIVRGVLTSRSANL